MTAYQLAKALLSGPDLEVKFYYDSGHDHLPIHQVILTKHWGLNSPDKPQDVLLLQEDDMAKLLDFRRWHDPAPILVFREDAPESEL